MPEEARSHLLIDFQQHALQQALMSPSPFCPLAKNASQSAWGRSEMPGGRPKAAMQRKWQERWREQLRHAALLKGKGVMGVAAD